MANKWIIYQYVPADRSAVSGIYVLETKGANGEIINRVGASISQLVANCLKEPIGKTNNVKLATIPSEIIDIETGTKFVRVSLNDL